MPTIKFLGIILISTLIIFSIILIKYKPAYAVTINGETIGYVENKEDFQNEINEQVLNKKDANVAFVSIDNIEYSYEYVARNIINEDTTLEKVKENSKSFYNVYEISDENNESSVYVNSLEEAEEFVNTLKEEYSNLQPELKITTLYLEEEISYNAIKEAKAKITEKLEQEAEAKKQQEEQEKRTVNGIYLACLPVTGNISSRYGSNESIRNHTHKGLDISAPNGTSIKAVATGTVKFAGYNNGGYGNLVIIDHGNGVTTYYGHCSKIYVSQGQQVNAGDLIAAVGSTGYSTGNHLHFEIRINDNQVNPQNYLYN